MKTEVIKSLTNNLETTPTNFYKFTEMLLQNNLLNKANEATIYTPIIS